MNAIKNTAKIEAVVLTALLIGTVFLLPVSSVGIQEQTSTIGKIPSYNGKHPIEYDTEKPFRLDKNYYLPDPQPMTLDDSNDDAGTKTDAGDKINRATPIYPGEMIDNTPGRGRTAKISSNNDEDWYFFSVCEGQTIKITMSPPAGFDYDLYLWDQEAEQRASSTNTGSLMETISYTADYTGYWFMQVDPVSGSGTGQYSFDVELIGQNDAGTGSDAGNSFASATTITPGSYVGYLDMNDEEDWYKFSVNKGQGIHFILEMEDTTFYSDFDIALYNPSGELVYEENYYYDDELLYPADEEGMWAVKIDIFPGYTDIPQSPDWEYYTYGSGAYHLEFSLESSAPSPPGPIPQPQITPVAKTFIINNDPNSNKDEYGYLAAIPACNYMENGNRYLAPIVYQGDDTETNYFGTDADRGTVDDTTQYLIDDWNDYLATYGKTALEYTLPADPIAAAAEIATNNWASSDLAVVAVDGSGFTDAVETVLETSATLTRKTEVEELQSDSTKLQGGYIMSLGSEWCAITLDAYDITKPWGDDACTMVDNLFPGYMPIGSDWWPTPYDGPGNATDLFMPLTTAGLWSVGTQLGSDDFSTYRITKIAGDRYTIMVNDPDSVLTVKVVTDELSDLQVFLVDPDGNLREPDIPQWNGPVNPIHVWNGFENPPYNPWREWKPEDHYEASATVLHPEAGKWTAIVVPRYEKGASSMTYTITAEIRTVNPKRADAAISAANAAVIASQEHVPLLYVTEDSVPAETQAAFTALGVTQVIFVERNGIGENVKGSLPTLKADLTTMQAIIDFIKDYSHSENYITITSIKTGDGYFAPASMIAAYHCSPVLRIGDAPGNPAAVADRIETWRLWDGDYYHGSRSPGSLPDYTEPLEGEGEWTVKTLLSALIYFLTGGNSGSLPPLGMDAKRYWSEELHDGIHDWIAGYGLDLEGQEAYCFVAPRKDIYLHAHSVMLGNNSYGGHIPGTTPAYVSAVAVRNVLYPALIFANPNRDITTTQLMNFPDGGQWTTNDGVTHYVYSSRELKKSFGSHFRKYEGHCLWEAHLKRMNDGASVFYYSGHGTGGSGISAQYIQTEHCSYPDQIWWDAWRGYKYDNWKTARYNGRVWYNAEPPMLYDIIHFDYVDELLENLRSNAVFYMSCSTGDGFGPMVYLDHGAVMWYGNAGSGLCPEADLQDDEFFKDALIYGEPVGQAYSKQVWLHYRDFTTKDPTSMYGVSSVGGYSITTVQCIYGDPNLILYSPEWTSPVPIDA